MINNVKSPYFRNTAEADAFLDKVQTFHNKPNAIAIGFDGDPVKGDCSFDITAKKTETENEVITSLLYVVATIAKKKGLNTKVIFTSDAPVKVVDIKKVDELAESIVKIIKPIL